MTADLVQPRAFQFVDVDGVRLRVRIRGGGQLGWTMLPWLWTFRQPTLVLVGDDDPVAPVVNARILARLIPGARLEVFRRGGHLFLIEMAPSAAALVGGFLTGSCGPADQMAPMLRRQAG
jgi:pimeloyl-ACP methyl ester carboxylesterase